MLRYFKRHIALASAAILLGILTQLLVPLSAVLEQRMIDLIVSADMAGFLQFLWAAAGAVLGIALGYFAAGIAEKWFTAAFWESLRNDLFAAVMERGVTRFAERDTAEYISHISSTVGAVVQNLTRPVFYLISYGVSALAVLGIMIWYSPILAGLSLACGMFSMILPLCFNKSFTTLMTDRTAKTAAMAVQLKEALNGHSVIASYGVFPKVRQRFLDASAAVKRIDLKIGIAIAGLENIGSFMDRAAWVVTFLVAGTMAARGDISLGTLVLFISLFGFFSSCLTVYAEMLPLLMSNKENIHLLLGIIDEDKREFKGSQPASLEEQLEMQGLSFQYKEGIPVIQNLDLTVRKNEKAALIGPSGCGKSTLMRLITGSYPGYTGSIRYDGTELHDIDPASLRKLVAVIEQNTFLFNDTLRYNICLGEHFPEEEIQRAVRAAGIDRFLDRIPGGLDGVCGENGGKLSGGERQRVALARALIRGVRVLILDEGVSAIDVATANEIEQELLDQEELTLLTITHRIKDGLTQQYHRILTMQDGKVQEVSSPEQIALQSESLLPPPRSGTVETGPDGPM